MKIVKRGSQPLSEIEFLGIKQLAEENIFIDHKETYSVFEKKIQARKSYLNSATFVDIENLKPIKIVLTLATELQAQLSLNN